MHKMREVEMKRLKTLFPISVKDTLLAVAIMVSAALVCMLLRTFDDGDIYVSMIFLLAVFLVSRNTTGYFYGIASSIMSVFFVNYVFTEPYMAFNFTLSGYPTTFVCMLLVSVITSVMTTQVKEREKLKKEADTEKMRSNLLRAVSHDLRTPLTSILGSVSAVLENGNALGEKKCRELILDVKNDAEWLIRMVENLLTVTRIGEGRAELQKIPQAVEEIVAESVEKYKKRWSRRLEVGSEQSKVNPSTPPVTVSVPDDFLLVPMDALLIEQVIINLIENAALHAKNAKNIWLRVRKNHDSAVFEVQDDGSGIAPELMDHIFDGYFSREKVNGGDTRRDMGIGLSVCKSIINAHGGTMKAENLPEGGAKFTFALPLEK